MDIFTAHPIFMWACIILMGAIALAILLPMVLSLFAVLAAAFTMISVGVGEIFGAKWGWLFAVVIITLIITTILCFTF